MERAHRSMHTHAQTDKHIYVDRAKASHTYRIPTRLALSGCTRNFCPHVFFCLFVFLCVIMASWNHARHCSCTIWQTHKDTRPHMHSTLGLPSFSVPLFLSFPLCSLFPLHLISTYRVQYCHLLSSNQTHMVWWVSSPECCTSYWLWMRVCHCVFVLCVCVCAQLLRKPHRAAAHKHFGLRPLKMKRPPVNSVSHGVIFADYNSKEVRGGRTVQYFKRKEQRWQKKTPLCVTEQFPVQWINSPNLTDLFYESLGRSNTPTHTDVNYKEKIL